MTSGSSLQVGASRNLFVYVDESGNFDFSPSGTGWFYLTALSTFDPGFGLAEWHAVKIAAVLAGTDLEKLHATEDRQWVRDRVFAHLASGAGTLRIDGIAVEKAKTNPSLQPPHVFYRRMAEYLLTYVVRGRIGSFDRLFIVLDTIPVAKKRRDVVGGLKTAMARLLPATPYTLASHDSRGEHLLQLADYCGWALYVARERREMRPRAAIASLIHSDWEVFAAGTTRYY